jgi:hypothetical protein
LRISRGRALLFGRPGSLNRMEVIKEALDWLDRY